MKKMLVGFLLIAACAAIIFSVSSMREVKYNRSEAALQERAQARWMAINDYDFETAYSYSTPSYRATFDLNHFSSNFGGQTQREKITVDGVEYLDESNENAKVKLSIHFYLHLQPGFSPIHEVGVKEHWQLINDKWYYVGDM